MTIPASVQTVINELARERRSGTNEPLICVNVDMQQALSDLGNGILPTSIANGDIIGNNSGFAGPPGDVTPTSILDIMAGSAQGLVMYRGSAWTGLATGTAGGLLQTNGAAANPSWTTPGQIVGTNTNDNANAGNIGEYISSTVAVGSGVSLTPNTITNITSIVLTPGDWDVSGTLYYVGSGVGTNATSGQSSITTVSAGGSIIMGQSHLFDCASQNLGNYYPTSYMGPARFNVSSNTTVYLVGAIVFFAGTMVGAGIIRARRVR